MMTMTNRPRNRGIKNGIVEFLMAHPDKDFTADGIAHGAGLPLMSVKGAMSKLVQEGLVAVGVTRGFWHYAGTERPAVVRGVMFEALKVRPNGEVIQIDENGDFWVARKVEM